jgi:hypothetical protein
LLDQSEIIVGLWRSGLAMMIAFIFISNCDRLSFLPQKLNQLKSRRNIMAMEITSLETNSLFVELTEEEAASLQGGAYFFNIPFFTGTGAATGGLFNPLNYGFVSVFSGVSTVAGAKTTGVAVAVPGFTPPFSPVGVNPLNPNAGIFQLFFA